MKYLLLVLFLLGTAPPSDASAQKSKRKTPAPAAAPVKPAPPLKSATPIKRLDTLTIGGLRPGDQLAAFERVSFKLDTVFWQGKQGANMLKGTITQFGHKGECRITTRDGEVQQVAFNLAFADSIKAQAAFKRLESEISAAFGDPDEEYHNVHQFIKWFGDKRILSLKGMDGASTLSVVLTSAVKK